MNNWKIKALLIVFCLLSFGCGQPNEVVEEEVSDIVSIQGITPMATKVVEKQEQTPTPEVTLEPTIEPTPTGPIGSLVSMDIKIDAEVYNGMNRKFTRDLESGASLFCLDEEENVYFVNQNRDNYLYRMKDGVVELAVSLPAKEIYPFKEFVYFMVSEDTKEQKAGDIYRYVKDTKEIQLVYALGTIMGGEQHKLKVDEQGIHFNYSEIIATTDDITRRNVSYYTLPFGASEPIKDTTNQGKAGWGEYYFSYSLAKDSTQPANVMLVNRTKGEQDSIPIDIGDFQYCVANDMIYSVQLGNSSIFTFDLKKQTKKYIIFVRI